MSKDEQIRLMNSLTNATNLAVGKPEVFKVDNREDFIDIVKFLYSIKVTDFGSSEEQELMKFIEDASNLTDLEAIRDRVVKTKNKDVYKSFNEKLEQYGDK